MVAHLVNPTREQLNDCIDTGVPAVLQGLTAEWKASRDWNLDYFSRLVGATKAQVVTSPSDMVYWDPKAGLAQKALTVSEFAEDLASRDEADNRLYLQEDMSLFPALRQDYQLPKMISEKPIKRAKLWVSPGRMVTSLHYDAVETLHWVVRGAKRFVCFQPGVRSYYPYSWRTTAPFISRVDAANPDYDRYPRFRRARPVEFEVREGEILYLPAFWWHQVWSLSPMNISVNFVWFAKSAKNLRYLPQFARCARHLAARLAEVRRKALVSQGLQSTT